MEVSSVAKEVIFNSLISSQIATITPYPCFLNYVKYLMYYCWQWIWEDYRYEVYRWTICRYYFLMKRALLSHLWTTRMYFSYFLWCIPTVPVLQNQREFLTFTFPFISQEVSSFLTSLSVSPYSLKNIFSG